MSVFRIAVCDDVALERELLCMLLQKYTDRQMISEFSSGEELLSSREQFDLVFLDIFMGGMTGMETAKCLLAKDPKMRIVFLTSSPNFALESYDVHAFDYILKPLQPKRLAAVLERFTDEYQPAERYLIINDSAETKKLSYDSIEFIESCQHYVTIHLTEEAPVRVYGKLDDFEQQLDDPRFLRCHKSFLINLSLTTAMGEDFLMKSGIHVTYRKREKKQLKEAFYSFAAKETFVGL